MEVIVNNWDRWEFAIGMAAERISQWARKCIEENTIDKRVRVRLEFEGRERKNSLHMNLSDWEDLKKKAQLSRDEYIVYKNRPAPRNLSMWEESAARLAHIEREKKDASREKKVEEIRSSKNGRKEEEKVAKLEANDFPLNMNLQDLVRALAVHSKKEKNESKKTRESCDFCHYGHRKGQSCPVKDKDCLDCGKKVISRTQRHVLRKRRLKKKPLVD